MADARRDGLLALATLVVLVVGTRAVGVASVLHPLAVATGVLGSLAIEWLFLASPALATGWERRGVPVASAVAVVAAAVVLTPWVPWLVGAAAWGLVTYGCLLGCVLAGWGNPVARMPTGRGR